MSSSARRLRAVLEGLVTAAVLVLPAVPARAAVSVVRITAASPQAPAMLRPRAPLYVRVEYESDEPIRLQARAWVNSRQVPSMMNPSPVYGAGKGEAIAWVALEDGERLDEIRVQIYDSRWRPLSQASEVMSVEWSVSAPASAPAPWVKDLNDFQQRGASVSMEQAVGPVWTLVSGVVLSGMLALVLGYPILQIVALVRARGTWRVVASLPLFVMVPTYGFCLYALSSGSNLWPIWAIFLSPPSAIVVGLALVMGVRAKVMRVE